MTSDVMTRPDTAASKTTMFADLLLHRRSVPAMRLAGPGPTPAQRDMLLTIAARVPDHGTLTPWRFIVAEGAARATLAERLAAACLASAADAAAREQAEKTAQKLRVLFGHPPLVVIVVARPDAAAKIPVQEQILSAGAACMNLINAATALGLGANWLTGWASTHPAARPILGMRDGESIAGVIPIGTATETPADRPRPALATIVTMI